MYLVSFFLCSVEILVFNANCVDPDQTPHSGASDLGQHSQCPFDGTPGINGLMKLQIYLSLLSSLLTFRSRSSSPKFYIEDP